VAGKCFDNALSNITVKEIELDVNHPSLLEICILNLICIFFFSFKFFLRIDGMYYGRA